MARDTLTLTHKDMDLVQHSMNVALREWSELADQYEKTHPAEAYRMRCLIKETDAIMIKMEEYDYMELHNYE